MEKFTVKCIRSFGSPPMHPNQFPRSTHFLFFELFLLPVTSLFLNNILVLLFLIFFHQLATLEDWDSLSYGPHPTLSLPTYL